MDLCGSTEAITIISTCKASGSPVAESVKTPSGVIDILEKDESEDMQCELGFHDNHGRNIQLNKSRTVATRLESYNQGLVVCGKPLPRGQLFQVIQ